MKLDELYEGLLEEGLSPVLFHATLASNALKILSSDTFKMSSIHSSDRDMALNNGKKYFLSSARTRISKLRRMKERHNDHVALFVLDGVRLGSNFKGVAVDFYGGNTEQEDRIISDKPSIKNFSKYVLRLDLFSKKGKMPSKQDIGMIKHSGVPVYFYNDYQSFVLGNTRNAINLTDVDLDTYTDDTYTFYQN